MIKENWDGSEVEMVREDARLLEEELNEVLEEKEKEIEAIRLMLEGLKDSLREGEKIERKEEKKKEEKKTSSKKFVLRRVCFKNEAFKKLDIFKKEVLNNIEGKIFLLRRGDGGREDV